MSLHACSVASGFAEPLPERLRAHVERLASEIGERNVWRPAALHAAAAYSRSEWQRQGLAVTAQRYEAYGVPCENLEVAFTGTARPSEVLVVPTGTANSRCC